MRVLLVEDETRIADSVSRGLSESGYAVDVASDGEEALQWTDVASFDVIVLDVMLPVLSGIEVCRTLRERDVQAPVLMLTARDAIEDRVRGLDSGADDYLVKPFAFAELLARLRALTRRPPAASAASLVVDDLRFDTLDPGGSTGRRRYLIDVQRARVARVSDAPPRPGPHSNDDRRTRVELRLRCGDERHRRAYPKPPEEDRRTVRGEANPDSPRHRLPDSWFADEVGDGQMPIRLRLTLWYAGLLAAILAVFGAGVYLTLRRSLYHNLDETIEARASGVLSSLRFDEGQPVLPDGSLITADGDDGFVRIVGPSDDAPRVSLELRVRTYDVVHEGEVVGRLLVGQSQEDVSEALRTLLLISVAAYVAALVVAVLTGVFLAGRALSPVDKVTGMARQISAENLEQRLNLDSLVKTRFEEVPAL